MCPSCLVVCPTPRFAMCRMPLAILGVSKLCLNGTHHCPWSLPCSKRFLTIEKTYHPGGRLPMTNVIVYMYHLQSETTQDCIENLLFNDLITVLPMSSDAPIRTTLTETLRESLREKKQTPKIIKSHPGRHTLHSRKWFADVKNISPRSIHMGSSP